MLSAFVLQGHVRTELENIAMEQAHGLVLCETLSAVKATGRTAEVTRVEAILHAKDLEMLWCNVCIGDRECHGGRMAADDRARTELRLGAGMRSRPHAQHATEARMDGLRWPVPRYVNALRRMRLSILCMLHGLLRRLPVACMPILGRLRAISRGGMLV